MKLISYEHTLYSLLIKGIEGKYFQNILAPEIIIKVPEKHKFPLYLMENQWFSVRQVSFNRKEEKSMYISLRDFSNYAEISKEQFEKYKVDPSTLSKVLLAH